MHVELSEILTCPDCRSPQGLIVMVEELDDDGRVREGELGCSRCQRRYPVRAGVADLRAREDDDPGRASGEEPPSPGGARPDGDLAAVVGGLLDLPSARGVVVLGPGLAGAAARLAELSDELRVVACVEAGTGGGAEGAAVGEPASGDAREPASTDAGEPASGEAGPGERGFTLLRIPPGRLPLLGGKVDGAALLAPGPEATDDARRALKPGGRLAVLRPDAELRARLEGSDLEVLASDERAVAARRRG